MRTAAFLVASVAGASVPGVPDSVGYLSTTHTIPTPLDDRTNGTGAATRYSLMLEGCCGWGDYNLPARLEPVIIQDVAEAGDADDDGHDGAQEARGDAPARRDGVDVQAHA